MATKTQAKAAIDNAVVAIKADIDNVLPTGGNISDGLVNFNPTKWNITMDAGGSQTTADSWASTIQTNLGSAARAAVTTRFGRRGDDAGGKVIRIDTALATYMIRNF